MKSKDAITSFQLFALIIRAVVGVGLFGLARNVVGYGKQDGWIFIVLAGGGIMVAMWGITGLCMRFPQYMVIEMVEHLIGKWMKVLLGILYWGYYSCLAAVVLRYLGFLMGDWFLHKTPYWAIMSMGMVPVVYISVKGVQCLIRFNQVVFMLLLPIFMLLLLGIQHMEAYNILPIFEIGWRDMLKGIIPVGFSFSGYEIILFFNPWISNRRQLRRTSLYAVGSITILYMSLVLIQIGYFGYEELEHLLYTVMIFLKAFEFPFLGRFELLFIFVWTAAIVSTISIYFFFSRLLLKKILLKGRIDSLASYWIWGACIVIGAYWIKDPGILLMLSTVLGYIHLGLGFILPLILFFLALVFKKKGGMNYEKQDMA